MENISETPKPRTGIRRFTPLAGERAQLAGAAIMWTVGASILLVRGVGYIHDRYWHAYLLAIAVVLGVVKSRVLLDKVARKAVDRIYDRGRACFFGFFSWKSWMFVAIMMGGGILLRNSGLRPGILAVIYIGVGTALLLADRIFWIALFRGRRAADVAAEPATAKAD